MSEHLPQLPDRQGAPRPAHESETPDWRRFEVASHRFNKHITAGLSAAIDKRTNIDHDTARYLAHVLGRSLGPDSALANFARTGDGDYETLREEYLALHNDPDITEAARQTINWLGVHLIHQKHPDARSATSVEVYPPRLDNVLVPTGVEVGDWYLRVNVPGIYGAKDIAELTDTLGELSVDQDAALRTYLSLPDVNAMSGDIMEDFHQHYVGTFPSHEDTLHELAEVDQRERDLTEYAAERQLIIEHVTPDYEALAEHVADAFDLVDEEGRVYAFYK